jgi:hypothetical protein
VQALLLGLVQDPDAPLGGVIPQASQSSQVIRNFMYHQANALLGAAFEYAN